MELVSHCKGHTKPVWSVVGMQDGRFISGSEDKTMKVWQGKTGQCIKTI